MSQAAEILGPNGRIAARLQAYEERPEQLAMAGAVERAMARRHHLVAEAGTGVGKSFAYLTPAILEVTRAADEPGSEEDERPTRAVISTHTINLQEQLLNKDLPLLRSVIPREFTAVLAKGRGNYISLRRLQSGLDRMGSLFTDDQATVQMQQIKAWSDKTTDGSLSDLEFRPLPSVWDEVGSDSGNCMGRKCPTYNKCFYFAARRRMSRAQIVIVNHALLCTDLALRNVGASILPDYDILVCDEAHTLESVAGEHLGLRITSGQIEYLLNRLYNDRTNRGLLVHHKVSAAQQEVVRCRLRAGDFFRDVSAWRMEQGPKNGRVTQPEIVPNILSPALVSLARMVKSHGNTLKDDVVKRDFIAAHDRLVSLAGALEIWRTQSEPGSVYWIEETTTRRGAGRITLVSAPLDVGAALRKHLFNRVPSVILTSATLAVGKSGSFDFFRSRVGLTQSESICVGSPFNYRDQVQLITLRDMPDPTGPGAEYEAKCAEMICRYVARSKGRAFVLFTSYAMMNRLAASLAGWLTQGHFELLCQGEGVSRAEMLRRFKESPRAVLFGTDSFWQGVDVPGDALQNVIITRLPFSVPDHPLLEARLDAIRQAGGVPFREFQLPEAIIKFKQGFGRLIRSRTDRGMVVILDPRVTTKPYGRMFLDSLPECRHVVESTHQVDWR